jgi:hypothetical protein
MESLYWGAIRVESRPFHDIPLVKGLDLLGIPGRVFMRLKTRREDTNVLTKLLMDGKQHYSFAYWWKLERSVRGRFPIHGMLQIVHDRLQG